MLFSPLEQFQILPLFIIQIGKIDFSITNFTIICFLGFGSFLVILISLLSKDNSFFIIPNRIQFLIESIYVLIYNLLQDNVGSKGREFFPFIFTLFVFILFSNLIGLVPYSFTITSHFIVTFSLALMVFIGVNLIGVKNHGLNILSLFLPSGLSVSLALLLVPIEFISHVFKPISLSLRLFANMMAGHTLLKVIAGFAWAMISAGSLSLLILHVVPLGIVVILFGLELAVAFIQAYVFTILSCLYLNDSINLH